MQNIVIIGFGSAGYAALMAAKKNNPGCDLTVIDPKEKDILHPCGLPFSLEGKVDKEKLIENINLKKMGVRKIKGRVVKIYPEKNTVQVETEIEKLSVSYSSLIIATGSHPFIPQIEGIQKFFNRGINTLTNIEDLESIEAGSGKKNNACVIGGGAIGIETAFALRKNCRNITLFEKEKNLLPGVIDKEISDIITSYLLKNKIKIKTATEITKFNGQNNLNFVSFEDKKIEADLCILATGFRPDLSLAVNFKSGESELDFDDNGIWVDKNLKTSVKNIYAAGDCISLWSVIDGSPLNARLATSAFKQGTVAGLNASGLYAEYFGSAGTFVTKTGELEIAGTGFTMDTAKEKGYKPVAGKITARIFPDYYPDDSEITIKIIADRESERILGAQAVGKSGASERINIISTCIEYAIPLSAMGRIEMAYCPSVREIPDPLMKAIEFTQRRIKKNILKKIPG